MIGDKLNALSDGKGIRCLPLDISHPFGQVEYHACAQHVDILYLPAGFHLLHIYIAEAACRFGAQSPGDCGA